MHMKVREGDFIETSRGQIFDVKGLAHPPNLVIAFLRYYQHEKGERERNGRQYAKIYHLSKRIELMNKNYPGYLVYDPVFDEILPEIPVDKIIKHYKPAEKLEELCKLNVLDSLEKKAVEFASILKNTAAVQLNAIGISGSIMVNLHTSWSDIDIVIYGSENCRRTYLALEELLSDKHCSVKPYSRKELKSLFDFRSKDTRMQYEDFVRTESRKKLQGQYEKTDYYIRFIKDWYEVEEKYGDVQYTNLGYAKVKATVVDDSGAYFTPCNYKIRDVEALQGNHIEGLEEIASFRGRFCEQAMKGEEVVAQGKVEQVHNKKQNLEYYRLLLGGKPSDYMKLA
ncbi:MAG: hypothetical protein PVF96_07890 [Candidatus Bathyarchaeota archaeon]